MAPREASTAPRANMLPWSVHTAGRGTGGPRVPWVADARILDCAGCCMASAPMPATHLNPGLPHSSGSRTSIRHNSGPPGAAQQPRPHLAHVERATTLPPRGNVAQRVCQDGTGCRTAGTVRPTPPARLHPPQAYTTRAHIAPPPQLGRCLPRPGLCHPGVKATAPGPVASPLRLATAAREDTPSTWRHRTLLLPAAPMQSTYGRLHCHAHARPAPPPPWRVWRGVDGMIPVFFHAKLVAFFPI